MISSQTVLEIFYFLLLAYFHTSPFFICFERKSVTEKCKNPLHLSMQGHCLWVTGVPQVGKEDDTPAQLAW